MKLRPEIKNALIATHRIHGSEAKEAIFSSWFYGGYSDNGLSEHSGGLQRLRNSYDGYDLLNNLNFEDLYSHSADSRMKLGCANEIQSNDHHDPN